MSIEGDLKKESRNWTLPVIVRIYENDKKGQKQFQEEAAILGRQGYAPQTQSGEGGHIHAGRLLLTGGLSIFAGGRGIRSKGKLNVTYLKVPVAVAPVPESAPIVEAPDAMAQLRQLAELRDAGVITAEDFETKKSEILARI